MSLFVQLLFDAIANPTINQFWTQCGKPTETQEKVLKALLRNNATSVYGRAHGFDTIDTATDTYAAFCQCISINDYADLKPYIDAACEGKPSQLTAENPVLFATTSGTTGNPKFIPVTPSSKATKSRLVRVWMSGLYQAHPDMFKGKILAMVSPEVEGYTSGGIPYGAESGHGYRSLPKVLKPLYAIPYDVFKIQDYEAKYYTILRLAAATSVSFIISINPSTVLLLAERLGHYTDSLIQDIREGTLNETFNLEPDIRAIVEQQLSPDPTQAAFLERAAAKTDNGQLLPKFVWPNLAVIGTWKGGNVGMYVERFDEYFRPGLAVRDVGYCASELRGSVPLSDRHATGALAISTNFYEFYPADAEAKPGPHDLLRVRDLKAGQRYFVYVTTEAGLYRYNMNDIIEVTDFYHNTPLIRFVQKGKGVVSFTGEKLYEGQVMAAVAQAFHSYDQPYEFIAAIGNVVDGKPQYAFLVEFEHPPTLESGSTLLRQAEAALREENMEYASKRDSYRILPPVLRAIQKGEFEQYRKREVEKGRKDGQFKIVRLTSDVTFEQEFKAIAQFDLTD